MGTCVCVCMYMCVVVCEQKVYEDECESNHKKAISMRKSALVLHELKKSRKSRENCCLLLLVN